MDRHPKDCPRCGKKVSPVGGLYRCLTCGSFDQLIGHHPGVGLPGGGTHVGLFEPEPQTSRPIDGKPIPIDRRFR